MMFELDPAYLEVQREAREFARRLEPIANEADACSELHPGVLAALRESGLSRLMVPAEYGGRSERLDPLAICLVREALMASCSHADSLFALQGIGSFAITTSGTPEQRSTWLPRVGRAEALAALALTEPSAGSDARAVTTRATPTSGGFLVSGRKTWISDEATTNESLQRFWRAGLASGTRFRYHPDAATDGTYVTWVAEVPEFMPRSLVPGWDIANALWSWGCTVRKYV